MSSRSSSFLFLVELIGATSRAELGSSIVMGRVIDKGVGVGVEVGEREWDRSLALENGLVGDVELRARG